MSLIAGAAGGFLLFLSSKIAKLNYQPLDYSVVSPTESTDDLLTKNTVLNICIFGIDRRDKTDNNSRSDSTMLISINSSLKKIKEVSFMRDTYVSIPGYGKNRLNVAIACGQESLAIKTLQKTFGIKMDKYITVDFDDFKNIIDILGGVEVKLGAKEADYINKDLWYLVDYPHLPERDGTYLLNGNQALSHARNRKIPTPEGLSDDFARTYRQRTVILNIIKKMRSSNLTEILKIINEIGPNIKTNFNPNEILAMAKNSKKYLNYKIEQLRLPTDNNVRNANINGMAVLIIPNIKKARFYLAKFVYEDDLKIKLKEKT